MSTLGDLIKNFRNDKSPKMSMERFSEISGLSKSYISMLEANKDPRGNPITPTLTTINKCAIAMGMDFEDLFNQLDCLVKINTTDDEWESHEDIKLSESEYSLIAALRKAKVNDSRLDRFTKYISIMNDKGIADIEKYTRVLANSGEYRNEDKE